MLGEGGLEEEGQVGQVGGVSAGRIEAGGWGSSGRKRGGGGGEVEGAGEEKEEEGVFGFLGEGGWLRRGLRGGCAG